MFADDPNFLWANQSPGGDIWGHPYIARNGTLITGSRVWIDYELRVPAGRLLRFYSFLQQIPTGSDVTTVRFQIWLPLDSVGAAFLLVYEKVATLANVDGIVTVSTLLLHITCICHPQACLYCHLQACLYCHLQAYRHQQAYLLSSMGLSIVIYGRIVCAKFVMQMP